MLEAFICLEDYGGGGIREYKGEYLYVEKMT